MKISGVYNGKSGLTVISEYGKHGLNSIKFGILNLSRGKSFSQKDNKSETVLVVLNGICCIECNGKTYNKVGKRNCVFESRSYAFYVPVKTYYRVTSISAKVEIAVCKAPAKKKNNALLITPKDVGRRRVGKGNYYRDVYDIAAGNVSTERLLVGETISPQGNWSSYPPHKHDVDNLPQESKLEELYFFRLEPSDGFGVIRIYDGKNMDEIYTVKNDDVVTIPGGYHPVGVIPGYKIYYLWVLAGKKRIMKPNEDPQYAWVGKK